MNKVVYFCEKTGMALEMAINKFASCYEILQISYVSHLGGRKSCMVLYKAD